jgi:hypothetical protein
LVPQTAQNRKISPPLDADIADVIVDGLDFLYTVFQMGNPERARPILERLFGKLGINLVVQPRGRPTSTPL